MSSRLPRSMQTVLVEHRTKKLNYAELCDGDSDEDAVQPDGDDVQSGMSGQSERPWGVVGFGREAKRPRSAPT